MGFLTGPVGLPSVLASAVIIAESVGALALAAGFLSRLVALGIASVMVGAVAPSHLSQGFFMNWSGRQGSEGFEYHLLALALALPIVVLGGGRYALDPVLARWLTRRGGTGAPAVSRG